MNYTILHGILWKFLTVGNVAKRGRFVPDNLVAVILRAIVDT